MLLRIFQLFSVVLLNLLVAENVLAGDYSVHTTLPDKPKDELAYPGTLDISAGWAVIPKANSSNQDASGYLVTIKAYPFGRWYAPLKPKAPQEAAKKILGAVQQQSGEAAAAAKNGVAISSTTPPNQQSLQDITDALTKLNSTELYQIQEANGWNRVSIFYGRSLGTFDSQAAPTIVNAIGFQVDITPDVSAMAGYTFYTNSAQNIAFTPKNRWIFGIQFNLNAISTFRNIGNSATSP